MPSSFMKGKSNNNFLFSKQIAVPILLLHGVIHTMACRGKQISNFRTKKFGARWTKTVSS